MPVVAVATHTNLLWAHAAVNTLVYQLLCIYILHSLDHLMMITPPPLPPEKEKSTVPPSQRVGGRPSVADFVDELTEVEDQVSRGPEDSQQTRGMTSSTATRELDELMANLENFEPASAKTDQSQSARDVGRTKSTAMDNLNSMLGSLDEDMTKRHGVKTAPKGEGGREGAREGGREGSVRDRREEEKEEGEGEREEGEGEG